VRCGRLSGGCGVATASSPVTAAVLHRVSTDSPSDAGHIGAGNRLVAKSICLLDNTFVSARLRWGGKGESSPVLSQGLPQRRPFPGSPRLGGRRSREDVAGATHQGLPQRRPFPGSPRLGGRRSREDVAGATHGDALPRGARNNSLKLSQWIGSNATSFGGDGCVGKKQGKGLCARVCAIKQIMLWGDGNSELRMHGV